MNYSQNYHDYLTYVQALGRSKRQGIYFERHHILPRCLGGTNKSENLVLLTPREHFLAHYLLTKIYVGPEHYRLLKAFLAMTYGREGIRYNNSRLFERAKEQFSEEASVRMQGVRVQPEGYRHSDETRSKLKEKRKGKKPALGMHHSEETKEKLSHAHDNDIRMWNDTENQGAWVDIDKVEEYLAKGFRRGGQPNSAIAIEKFKEFSKKPKSEEHKEAISKALKGKKKSKESIEKRQESRRRNAIPISEETRKKISENSKNRVWIHQGARSKMCRQEDLAELIALGWKVGRYDRS